MQQTALEQSILIGELVRSYAVLRVAQGIPSEREFADLSLRDLEQLTAELQAEGFLPKTHSGATSRTSEAARVRDEAINAARSYLQNASAHIAENVQKHGLRYLMGANVTDHAYLSDQQKAAVNAINTASQRMQAIISRVCDKDAPTYDPRVCASLTAEAVKLMTTPPGAGSTWQNWLLFAGVAGSLFYYFVLRRN